MQHLKFFSLLQKLDEKEVQEFFKYLKLIHAGEDVALKVFGYIRKFHPHFEDDKKLELDYAYRKIFRQPVSDKSRKNILNTFSDLYLWLKDFLLQEKVRQDTSAREMLWLSILHERELNAEFSKTATRFFESRTAEPPSSLGNSVEQITAAYFMHQHLSLLETKPDLQTLDNCLQITKEATDTICARIFCERTQLEKMAKFQTPASNMPALQVSPLRMVYNELQQLVQQDSIEDEQHFTQSFQLLSEHTKRIDPSETYIILKHLRNYAGQQIMHKNMHKNMHKYKGILHQLNRFGFDNQAFTQKNEMPMNEFNNIVNAACGAQDFEWAKRFIAEKANLLPYEIRHDTVIVAQATLAFEQKKFKEVWQSLEHIILKQPFDYARARLLFLRACYEDQPEHIDLITECDRFENWLYRNRKLKIPSLAATSAFVQIFKLILNDRQSKEALLERIHKTQPLILSDWLIAKLADYKARYAPQKPGK